MSGPRVSRAESIRPGLSGYISKIKRWKWNLLTLELLSFTLVEQPLYALAARGKTPTPLSPGLFHQLRVAKTSQYARYSSDFTPRSDETWLALSNTGLLPRAADLKFDLAQFLQPHDLRRRWRVSAAKLENELAELD